jgi:phytoene dehydrogenase-like protein
MTSKSPYDAVVVGSGPNGLAAAITLARAGRSVVIIEAAGVPGGGTRTKELTLPGYLHDVCSTAHPLGLASPFFRSFPLADHGLQWVQPPSPLAHPLDGGRVAMLERSLSETSQNLGLDGPAYVRLMEPFATSWEALIDDFFGPLHLPRHLFRMLRFGLFSLIPATVLGRFWFKEQPAQALFAGMSAHSIQPLERPLTSGFGLMLGALGHAVGWPLAAGGSQNIANALVSYLRTLKGELILGTPVTSLDQLPPARVTLLDLTPRHLVQIAGNRLPVGYRRQLEHYRYGPGVYKIDYALDSPVPWHASECARAGTVHLGGTLEEVAASESAIWRGEHPERPFVLVVQPTLFDSSRAPEGKHTLWAYCHVPNGSNVDMTDAIENQIERFAPGFRQCILKRSTFTAQEMEWYNPNYIGGDIIGGVQDATQFFTRPVARWVPYSTPVPGLYLCSSSTPPGGGVHGMCGYYAAQAALKYLNRS